MIWHAKPKPDPEPEQTLGRVGSLTGEDVLARHAAIPLDPFVHLRRDLLRLPTTTHEGSAHPCCWCCWEKRTGQSQSQSQSPIQSWCRGQHRARAPSCQGLSSQRTSAASFAGLPSRSSPSARSSAATSRSATTAKPFSGILNGNAAHHHTPSDASADKTSP
eukprot:COSAG04_NODE_5819_length_1485_cov_1.251082_2_plen_162_part_00